MQSLFEHGLAGPSPGPIPWAVTASWDGYDLDFAGDEGVVDHVKAWGYRTSDVLVDNDDWRSDLMLPAIAHSDVAVHLLRTLRRQHAPHPAVVHR